VLFRSLNLSSLCNFNDSQLSSEEFSSLKDIQEYDLEAKFRSVTSESHKILSHVSLASREVPLSKMPSASASVAGAPQPLREGPKINFSKKDPISKKEATPKIEIIASSSRPLVVPPEPFHVSPLTHFVTKFNVGDTKARVEAGLSGVLGVAFEFFSAKCRWEGVYLVGSSRCKFEFNLYKRLSGGLIVAGNRLSGDSFAFVIVYKAVALSFDDPSLVFPETPRLPIPPPKKPADPHAIKKSIDAVLRMASSGIGEAQVGAAQILCDLSKKETMHADLISNGCVDVLVKLTEFKFEACDQHAICALANLSSSRSCQEVLIRDQAFLHSLLHLCRDGSFDTIEMRRECARLLANLSSGEEGARQVVASAGPGHVSTWLGSVQDLKDERLRTHANSVRNSLAACT